MKSNKLNKTKYEITTLILLSILMLFTTKVLAQDILSEISTESTLTGAYADPSNSIVLTKGYYIISFNAATSGAIKKVEIEFPSGYVIDTQPHLLIALGIGDGSIVKDSLNPQKLIYTVSANPPPSIPSGRNIKYFIANVKNNGTTALQSATITTRDSSGNIIDGPTGTSDIQLTQITTPMVGDNSVTTSNEPEGQSAAPLGVGI